MNLSHELKFSLFKACQEFKCFRCNEVKLECYILIFSKMVQLKAGRRTAQSYFDAPQTLMWHQLYPTPILEMPHWCFCNKCEMPHLSWPNNSGTAFSCKTHSISGNTPACYPWSGILTPACQCRDICLSSLWLPIVILVNLASNCCDISTLSVQCPKS